MNAQHKHSKSEATLTNGKELLTSFVADISAIINNGIEKAYQGVNSVMIRTYWLVGRRIVEEEQKGDARAEYGKQILKDLAHEMVLMYGDSYSERNLYSFRKFYLSFNDWEILNACVQNLKWTHFRSLLRVEDADARYWYMNETAKEMWSTRTLDRNISTQYYYRLLQSPKKEDVVNEMKQLTSSLQKQPDTLLKNPIVTEFLQLPSDLNFTETQLESAIIDHIREFIMEMGHGFAFVARQQHIRTDMGDFYIDLVFYNYVLKCFLLVDLKIGLITHQDVGQMDMYVRMYDQLKCTEGDNPTVGLILCSDTSEDMARYSILNDNHHIFQAKYLTYLPSTEALAKEIERQKEIFRIQHGEK